MRMRSLLFWTGLCVVTAGAYTGGKQLAHAPRSANALPPVANGRQVSENGPDFPAAALPLAGDENNGDSRQAFSTVYRLVQQYYVNPLPSRRTMSEATLTALFQTLNDPDSHLLTPQQRTLLEREAQGTWAGIGAVLRVKTVKREGYTQNQLTVHPLPQSPAQTAGLRAGDTVTHINGRYILGALPYLTTNRLAASVGTTQTKQSGLSLLDARMVLHGDTQTAARLKLSTPFTLRVQRTGTSTPVTVTITPKTTQLPSAQFVRLPDGTACLRIYQFTDLTPEEVIDALEKLKDGEPLLVDLRGNPGGSVASVQAVASYLLAPGATLLHEVTAKQTERVVVPAPSTSASQHGVITVLVDSGTASTAEALAIALRQNYYISIVGERTAGDNQVQTTWALGDGGFVLTTGRLLSPLKTNWAQTGVTPTVRLASTLSEAQILTQAGRIARRKQQAKAAPLPGETVNGTE